MKDDVWRVRTCRRIIAVVILLIVRTVKLQTEGEESEVNMYYYSADGSNVISSYPWIVSLWDLESDNHSCTANVILAHLSLTGCECLLNEMSSNETAELVMRKPGKRYMIVGGITLRKYVPGLEELETIKFIIHDECRFDSISQSWDFNYGLIVHEPFEATPRVSPMPVWSAHADKIELRYQEIVNQGEPCFLIGWKMFQRRQIRIRVTVSFEPLAMVTDTSSRFTSDCTRLSCSVGDLLSSTCSKTAVSCISNVSMGPYCDLEPGMPLVCGTTGEVYAISSGFSCDTNGTGPNKDHLYNSMWKLSFAMDWLTKIELAEFQSRLEKVALRDQKEKEELNESPHPSSQPAIWKVNHILVVLVPLEIVHINQRNILSY